jgi:peroxiredoxin
MPAGTFKTMTKDGPQDLTTDQLFKGKKVVLFSVPGAFTPTCDAKHLPGFVGSFRLQGQGIDTIACMAVNDVFVMGAWGKHSNVGDNVLMLADGNGDYAKALGLEMDGRGFGMGTRGQRFAIVVNDGVATNVEVEAPKEFKSRLPRTFCRNSECYFLDSSMSFSSSGTIVKRSPTSPKSATSKIGASASLLMATIVRASLMPVRC